MKKDQILLSIARYMLEGPKLNIQVASTVNTITIDVGQTFYGNLHVHNYSKYSELIYVEPLKGMIEFHPNDGIKTDYLNYHIDSTKCIPGLTYEEQVRIYYPGDIILVDFSIEVKPFKIVNNLQAMTKPQVQVSRQRSKEHSEKEKDVQIRFEKQTYGLEDAIELKLYNYSDTLKSIMIESEHDLIHPKNTEFFLKDTWTQEWYIQQTTWDRIVGRVIFKDRPFEDIIFSIRINTIEEAVQYQSVQTMATAYPSYVTSIRINDTLAYQKLRQDIMQRYVLLLTENITRKQYMHLVNDIKACLNFNQSDFELRLLYIWILVETSDLGDYEYEAKYLRKYREHYQKQVLYPVFLVFEKIMNQAINKRALSPEDMTYSSHWLILLIQARYVGKGFDRYLYYKYIYETKIYHGFLFAEAVRFMNKYDITLDADDRFYSVCIQWALNKSCFSKHWLHRMMTQKKIWVRKNPYMTSRLLMQIYKVYPSNELLRMCCEKAIEEKRKDRIALEFYMAGLAEGRYIKDLDRIYVETASELNQEIDFSLLKYMNFVRELSISSQGYLYVKMIEMQIIDFNPYSRLYQELIDYIKSMSHDPIYMESVVQILYQMKEYLFPDHFYIIDDIMDSTFIQYVKTIYEGQSLLYFLIDYARKRIDVEEYKKLLSRIDGFWVLNKEEYDDYIVHEERFIKFLKFLIDDHSYPHLLELYENLNNLEQNQVRKLLCEKTCRRILIDDMSPNRQELRFLQDCYAQEECRSKGLLLTLLKVDPYHPCRDDVKERQLIVPWSYKNSGKTLESSIQYYGELEDELTIYYRYEEDETFRKDKMQHVVFGLFIHPVYLFYGEYMQYYIVKKAKHGKSIIVVSDSISKYTVEAHLDFIPFAMEVADDQGVDILLDEYEQYRKKMRGLSRI